MPYVRYNVSYQGLTAVYPSSTGLVDVRTGLPELGGGMNLGDTTDFTEAEAQALSPNLHEGRYRFVQVLAAATAANIKRGSPVGWGVGTTVQQIALAAAGSGYTPDGTYSCVSTVSGGTVKAVAQVVVSGGAIISATLSNPGAGFTSVPTFSLSELSGGSGGSILAQMATSPNSVTSFDASALSLSSVRGVFLAPITAAQIAAGAFVWIQETGMCTALVTTATNTAPGCAAAATTGGVVTTTTVATSTPIGFFGYTLDLAAANTLVRVEMRVTPQQG
jgi:hypothetical protein